MTFCDKNRKANLRGLTAGKESRQDGNITRRMDRSGFEPEASCLQSKRSTADLPALLCRIQ